MKPVSKITINPNSDFWKSIKESANLDADKAAAQAAEKARKEVIERAEKRAVEKKAYLDSIRHYDKIEFKNNVLRQAITTMGKNRAELHVEISKIWVEEEKLRKQLQEMCSHNLCLEVRVSYQDDYDNWHDGSYQRKCIECFLVEESDLPTNHRNYDTNYGKKYHKLEKSQVVLLRKTVDDKEYELEFDDLKW